MTHRESQIVDRIAVVLAANANLRAQVFTHRTLSLADDEGELPAVCVQYGADDPLGDTMSVIDSLLEVRVIAYAANPDEVALRLALSDMRQQVHIALLADQTLGLAFVSDCRYGGAGAPLVARTEQFVAERLFTWRVAYRMNYSDPG